MFKKDLFILFTDVDKTLLPPDGNLDPLSILTLAETLKNIQRKHPNLLFKLSPVTGRDASYTEALMVQLNDAFTRHKAPITCDMGSSEQGCILVDTAMQKRYFTPFDSLEEKKDFMRHCRKIHKITQRTLPSSFFEPHGGKRYASFFYKLKDTYLNLLTNDSISKVLGKAQESLESSFRHFGIENAPVILTIANKYLEISPLGFNKDRAVQRIYEMYRTRYNIVGMSFSGDGLNDLSAIKYISKLSEIPGIRAHVFLPANARECISNNCLEEWKDRLGSLSNGRIIMKGHSNYFQGVTECLKKCYEDGLLLNNEEKIPKEIPMRRTQSEPNLGLS